MVKGARDLSGVSFMKTLIPFVRASPAHLPGASPPTTIKSRGEALTYALEANAGFAASVLGRILVLGQSTTLSALWFGPLWPFALCVPVSIFILDQVVHKYTERQLTTFHEHIWKWKMSTNSPSFASYSFWFDLIMFPKDFTSAFSAACNYI